MNELKARRELVEAIAALADVAPSMRFGQLLAALGEICGDLHGRGLWEAEDQELLEAAWKLHKDIEVNLPVEVKQKH